MHLFLQRIVFTCVIVLSLSGCKKDETIFDSFFFVSWNDSQGPMSLHINGELIGEMPFVSSRPSCDNDSLKQVALRLHLKSGKYKLEAKDQQGVVKSSGSITLSSTKTSSSGGTGGQEVAVMGDCAMIVFTK